MLEEEAIVIEANGTEAKVQMERTSACDTCAAAFICHPDDKSFVEVTNPVGALKGQKVKVVVEPSLYLKASALVYGLPIFVFLITAILSKYFIVQLFGEPYSDLYAFLSACVFTGVTFAILILLFRKDRAGRNYRPVIVEIL